MSQVIKHEAPLLLDFSTAEHADMTLVHCDTKKEFASERGGFFLKFIKNLINLYL